MNNRGFSLVEIVIGSALLLFFIMLLAKAQHTTLALSALIAKANAEVEAVYDARFPLAAAPAAGIVTLEPTLLPAATTASCETPEQIGPYRFFRCQTIAPRATQFSTWD